MGEGMIVIGLACAGVGMAGTLTTAIVGGDIGKDELSRFSLLLLLSGAVVLLMGVIFY